MATKLSTFNATAATATAASHYYVETADDGFIRPKTLANVKAEIVSTDTLGTGTANTSYFLRGDRTWSNSFGGNLGIEKTPSAWDNTWSALEVGDFTGVTSGSLSTFLLNNVYYDGVNWVYKTAGSAMYYQQVSGSHIFYNSLTGSAGATAFPIERMRINSIGSILQPNATSGFGAIVGEQTFQLAVNGAAIGPTIADFFGTNSSISLEANSTYQITAYCVFLKTTAGTATWTMTASSAPNRMVGTYLGSPITGIAAGAVTSGFTGSQAATTAAFPATGSLSTAVNHSFQFTMQVQTNLATNFRLQITNNVSGTATPLAGSYYTVKKISGTTGTFVA